MWAFFFIMIKIGIDPDVTKSGFALTYQNQTELTTYSFFELFDRLGQLSIQHQKDKILVYVECGFLNKSNWHKLQKGSSNINAKIGERTGANFETAKKICEMCEYLGLKYIQVKPTRKKLNAAEFKAITKIEKRTNQEMRDAFMLIFQ